MKNDKKQVTHCFIDLNNLTQRLDAFLAIGQLYRIDDNKRRTWASVSMVQKILFYLTELQKNYVKNRNILKQCGINFIKGCEWLYISFDDIKEAFRGGISITDWKNFLVFSQKWDILSVRKDYVQINFLNLRKLALKSSELFPFIEETQEKYKSVVLEEYNRKEYEEFLISIRTQEIENFRDTVKFIFNRYISKKLEEVNYYKNIDNHISSEKQKYWDNLDELIRLKKSSN